MDNRVEGQGSHCSWSVLQEGWPNKKGCCGYDWPAGAGPMVKGAQWVMAGGVTYKWCSE